MEFGLVWSEVEQVLEFVGSGSQCAGVFRILHHGFSCLVGGGVGQRDSLNVCSIPNFTLNLIEVLSARPLPAVTVARPSLASKGRAQSEDSVLRVLSNPHWWQTWCQFP